MTARAASHQNDVAIRVSGLVNRFGKQVLHDNLSFEVKKGEILGLVGGSGSGKSVLMRTIIGLKKPNEGTIEINAGGRQIEGNIGVLFQQGALFSNLTVAQNIMVPLREHTDLPDDMCRQLAYMKIALVGLPPEAGEKYPSELSGGMIKRAGLARALALDSSIIFLDEPTAGLDPIAAADFDQLILDLQKALGATVIIITHDLDTLFTVCDRVAVLVDKKITLDTVANLMQSDHPWIKNYFHGPRARAAQDAVQRDHDVPQHASEEG